MIYKFPPYIPCIAAGVAVLSVIVGLFLLLRQKSMGGAIALFALAAFAGGLIAPALAMDRVVLNDEKLEQTCGFWFAPTVKGFRLADVSSISISTARDRNNRAYELWKVQKNNGQIEAIDPGDLWDNNSADIIARLEKKGIHVDR